MRRLRLTLEYDGTDFQGWQVQASGRSVQGVVEEAFAKVISEAVRLVAAGRTDAGVHARGQSAHVDVASRLSAEDLRRALNAVLPEDVAVLRLQEAPAGFHARRDARSKQYVYRILNCATPSPLRSRFAWQVRATLQVDAMREAASGLLGTHDFRAFRGAPGGAPPGEETCRTLERLDVVRTADEVRVVAEGRSFLRYMVRTLVGTLVEVGLGRRQVSDLPALLDEGERARAGPTAPALGLCLEWIRYAQDEPLAGPGSERESAASEGA